jgi:hypothetical protein
MEYHPLAYCCLCDQLANWTAVFYPYAPFARRIGQPRNKKESCCTPCVSPACNCPTATCGLNGRFCAGCSRLSVAANWTQLTNHGRGYGSAPHWGPYRP